MLREEISRGSTRAAIAVTAAILASRTLGYEICATSLLQYLPCIKCALLLIEYTANIFILPLSSVSPSCSICGWKRSRSPCGSLSHPSAPRRVALSVACCCVARLTHGYVSTSGSWKFLLSFAEDGAWGALHARDRSSTLSMRL